MKLHSALRGMLAVAFAMVALQAHAGRWEFGFYNNPTDGAITRGWEVYIPTNYNPATPTPMVVALHGCAQTPQTFNSSSRWTALAEQRNFIVLFPAQATIANPSLCWNWYSPTNQMRGYGEPAVVKGMVDVIKSRFNIDGRRVYSTGISAGAALSAIMAACYSDVFAASAVHSGPMYKAATTLIGSTNAMFGFYQASADSTGYQAWQCSGSPNRQMPMMVFQGQSDSVVNKVNGDQVIKQFAQVNDYGDDRSNNNSVVAPARSYSAIYPGSGKHSYYLEKVTKNGKDILVQYRVNGMGHAWSGGAGGSLNFADAAGPDATTIMYNWFLTHSR
ncbi:MAG TPA: PHB depolymerase family esterase [Rhodocyclaceae bacterium]|nr:PHB depolymerase family esterase [Rhodocyclaceae bacterium]